MKKFAVFKYQPSGAPGVLKRYGRGLLAAAAFFAAAGIFLLANGGLPRLNSPSGERYPVRGVDVSVYQGGIDWKTLAEQGISFAFIKATEGSSSVDPNFCWNYSQARQSGLRIGAYHFLVSTAMGLHKLRTLFVWWSLLKECCHRWWMLNFMAARKCTRLPARK